MAGKKHRSDLGTTIKLGTRVRHEDDGALGRIVWANAASVKIQWDDGEKVTWKRAELGSKGLTVVEADDDSAVAASEPTAASELAPVSAVESAPVSAEVPDDVAATEVPSAKKRTRRSAKPQKSPEKKPSALDAAAKVLAEEGRPMGCQELIGAMAIKSYWTSPGGQTPAATLYSAILRELATKGDAARFVKVGRGQFALRPQA